MSGREVTEQGSREGRLTPLIVLVRPAQLVHDLEPELVERLLVQRPELRVLGQLGHAHRERDVWRRVAHDEPRQLGWQRVRRLLSATHWKI